MAGTEASEANPLLADPQAEPAQAPATPPAEVPLGPIRGGRGQVFEILEQGLRITTSNGCFKNPTVTNIAWDDFRRCDVETHCFSGTVTLAQADGDCITIKVPLTKVRPVATAIYKHMNMGKRGRVNPDITKLLGRHPHAMIFGSGLVFVRSHGACKKASTFVPWEAVVSMSLRSGCCKSCITVKTMLEMPDEGEADQDHHDSKDNLANSHENEGPSHVEVSIPGQAEALEKVFEMIMEVMNGGCAPELLPEGDAVPGTQLTTLGLVTTHGSCRHMLPWSSVSTVDLQTLCWMPRLVLTDCTGAETVLRKVVPGEFNQVRNMIAKARGATGPSAATTEKPIIRKNVKMTSDGLSVTAKHLCSSETRFISWNKIDAFEMDVHCSGGALTLITETGERMQVCRASIFGLKAMQELASRIQELKYGKSGHQSLITFAGREGDPRSCLLTKSSVRLVERKGCCSRLVRILDLDSVNGAQAAGPRKLVVSLRESMGIDADDTKPGDQPLEVHLWRGDDAEQLAAEVMHRASARKHQEA